MPLAKPHLSNLYRTPILKNSRRSFLRLDMNESVDGLPEEFVKSVLSEIDQEFLAAYPEYYTVIQKIAEHNHVLPENICISNGSDGVIKCIFDCYISSGHKVLIADPSFAMYPVYCQMFNAQTVNIPYRDDFTFPLDAFLNRINPEIRMAVVVNPNNPTGVALDPPRIQKLIAKCEREDVLLILDEAYFYFYNKTAIEKIKRYQNLIVVRTFSKLCGFAALRLGYATACPTIVDNLKKVKPTFDVNGIAVLFAEKLLDSPQIITESIEKINEGKKFLAEKLTSFGIGFRMGEANFVLIKCNQNVSEMISRLAKKKILVAGGFKQAFLKDYIRVTIGRIESMRQFCDVFFTEWEKLNNRI